MRRVERPRSSSVYHLFRAYVHTHPRKRFQRPEPKSDAERTNLGLPLREPWFEVKPFDEKKMRFVLSLKDTLQAHPTQRIEIAVLSNLRRELDVHRQGKQRKITTYVRRFPAAFTLRSSFTPQNRKKTWCGFSLEARMLLEEEDCIFRDSEALLVQKLRKVLMISMKNRLPIATVDKVRQSLGLPVDYVESVVRKYPDVFLLKERKGFLYLELKEWDESLAVTVFEKNIKERKYVEKPKKKRSSRLLVEENEQDALCKVNPEQSFSSGEEEHDAMLIEEGQRCRREVLSAMHRQGEPDELVLADEGDECLSQQNDHQGHVKLQELGNAGSEKESVDMSSNRDWQSTVLLNLEREAHVEDLSALKLNEQECSSFDVVDLNKDGQPQSRQHALGDDKPEENQSESIEGMFANLPRLRFPWILKKGRKPKSQRAAVIESFQSLPYISPYRNSRELVLPPHKTLQTDKFLVGLIHEFLSLTLEKRATVQQLELFQRPYRLPNNLVEFLLKYDGIFYVAEGTTKSHVFLKEGYKEFDLLEKDPLLLWRERFVELAFSPEKRKAKKGTSRQDVQSFSEESREDARSFSEDK